MSFLTPFKIMTPSIYPSVSIQSQPTFGAAKSPDDEGGQGDLHGLSSAGRTAFEAIHKKATELSGNEDAEVTYEEAMRKFSRQAVDDQVPGSGEAAARVNTLHGSDPTY